MRKASTPSAIAPTATGRTRTDQNITSSVLGDGGIYTSIDDLIKWNAALDSAKLLPRAVLDEATMAGKLTTGEPLNYAYGWFVDPYRATAVIGIRARRSASARRSRGSPTRS